MTPEENTMTKQFCVPGHTLVREGARHHADGDPFTIWDPDYADESHSPEGHGKCSCGEVSDLLPSKAARKRWHRDHKHAVKATR